MEAEPQNEKTRNYTKIAMIGSIVMLIALGGGIYAIKSQETANNPEIVNLLASGWSYLPGGDNTANGLEIKALDRQVVQKDGSTGQYNTPVNLLGTHLNTRGDFRLDATMTDIQGEAVLRLYDNPPVVQDEFIVEPKYLQFRVNNNNLFVEKFDGYNGGDLYKQEPARIASSYVDGSHPTELSLQHNDGRIDVFANDKKITSLQKSDLFNNGSIWFGPDARTTNGHWRLTKLEAKPLNEVHAELNITQADVKTQDDQNRLQILASKHRPDFKVGAAMALGPMVGDPSYRAAAFGGDFGALTTENSLKWQFIHPQPNTYDFSEADAMLTMARANNMAVHGHTLVFGEANPEWVQTLPVTTETDKQHVRQVMVDHIKQTVNHFRGKIASWDVINEPLADYDEPTGDGGLRPHIWYEAMGVDYIQTALNTARQADPNAKLFINEFGLEEDGERWDNFLSLVTKLKQDGVPLDGVGFQAHVYTSDDDVDPAVLRRHIQQLSKLGLVSRVSEVDVYSNEGTDVQANQYGAIFDACFQEPSCVGWTTWGVTNRYDMYQNDDNRLARGQDFLWNIAGQPTPALIQLRAQLAAK